MLIIIIILFSAKVIKKTGLVETTNPMGGWYQNLIRANCSRKNGTVAVFFWVLQPSLASVTPAMLHTHSFIYH
jgi:hypothetical protein